MAGGSLDVRRLEEGIGELIAALDGIDDENLTVSGEPMREIVGASWVSVRAIVKSDPDFVASGAVSHIGKEGDKYIFKVKPTLRLMILNRTRMLWSQRRQANAAMAKTGVSAMFEKDSAESIKHAADMMRLTRETRRMQIEDGSLIPRTTALEWFKGFCQTMQMTAMSAAQKADPTSAWPPEFRQKFEDAMGDVLVACVAKETEIVTSQYE